MIHEILQVKQRHVLPATAIISVFVTQHSLRIPNLYKRNSTHESQRCQKPIFCNFTSASNRPILLAAAPFVSQNAQDGTPHCSITCHVHHHRDLEIPRSMVVSCKSSISTGRKKSHKKKRKTTSL